MNANDVLERYSKRAAARFMFRHGQDAPLIFQALLAAEDHRAVLHSGVDWFSLTRAVAKWPINLHLKGVSTVEQQLVRTLFPRRGRLRWLVKFREFWMAAVISRRLPKAAIWAAYLYCAYYGRQHWSYARVRACFSPAEAPLDERAAAGIVSCLKYPIPHRPIDRWQRRHSRRTAYVLGRFDLPEQDRQRYLAVIDTWGDLDSADLGGRPPGLS